MRAVIRFQPSDRNSLTRDDIHVFKALCYERRQRGLVGHPVVSVTENGCVFAEIKSQPLGETIYSLFCKKGLYEARYHSLLYGQEVIAENESFEAVLKALPNWPPFRP